MSILSDIASEAQIQVLDHTADMGFLVTGKTITEIFELSALALTSILTNIRELASSSTQEICVEAPDREGLMYAWLSEVLYLFDGEKKLFSSFRISELNLASGACKLTCIATGDDYDSAKHQISTYVKAITFHQMEIIDTPDKCSARVFIDI